MILDEDRSKDMLARFGIRRPGHVIIKPGSRIPSPLGLRAPFYVKAVGAGIAHKTELGAVEGGIADALDLRAAVARMREKFPGRAVMVEEAVAHDAEFIIGIRRDPEMGPVVVFGSGGYWAELNQDAAFRKPPFDAAAAKDMIRQTRIGRVFDGYRGRPVDAAPMVAALLGLSELVLEMGDAVSSLDVNPAVICDGAVIALDAKMELDDSFPLTPR